MTGRVYLREENSISFLFFCAIFRNWICQCMVCRCSFCFCGSSDVSIFSSHQLVFVLLLIIIVFGGL